MMADPLHALENVLEHAFRDRALLEAALTHRSAAMVKNNERLEFLGDAVLNLAIAAALFAGRPDAREGDLSRLRASLVNQATLAEVARELRLGDYLRLGPGERRTSARQRDSVLSDALEAVLGAVYLDAGHATCERLIQRLFDTRLAELPAASTLKDGKTRLQEYLQGRQRPVPEYAVLSITGPAHDQVFEVECRLPDTTLVTGGVAGSRRRAEQQAATAMLERLQLEE